MICHYSGVGMAATAVKVMSSSMESKKEAGLFLKEMLSSMILEAMASHCNLNYRFGREVHFNPISN